MGTKTIFLTSLIAGSASAACLMIRSLRRFGGELAQAPFWVFTSDPDSCRMLEDEHTRVLPLVIPASLSAYTFGDKVTACARAEKLAPRGTHSLVWIDPFCLIVQPPALFALDAGCDAAFRPVHVRNVGLPPSTPLDAFWIGICAAVGVDDISSKVTSFVDGQLLRTYFNSHAFAINPRLGLMTRWIELFQKLVSDDSFQSTACADDPHRVFLFQALLSALVASSIDQERVCILPDTYNYPYHLQEQIPAGSQFAFLNETVCFTYEDTSIHPDEVTGIKIREPLVSWLQAMFRKERERSNPPKVNNAY